MMSTQQTLREQTRAAQPREQSWQEREQQNGHDSWLPTLPMASDPHEMANGLGWFSITLGLAQLLAPRQVAQLIGVDAGASQAVLRSVGLREIVSGIGILSQPQSQRANWIKARVGGDVMDLALLGKAYTSGGNDQGKVTTALVAVAGITALDLFCSQQLGGMQDGLDQQA